MKALIEGLFFLSFGLLLIFRLNPYIINQIMKNSVKVTKFGTIMTTIVVYIVSIAFIIGGFSLLIKFFINK